MDEQSHGDTSAPDDVPTPEKILWANTVEALLTVMSPRQKMKFLRAMTRNFKEKRNLENVMRIRPAHHDARLRECIREAEAWTLRCMPVFIEGVKDD